MFTHVKKRKERPKNVLSHTCEFAPRERSLPRPPYKSADRNNSGWSQQILFWTCLKSWAMIQLCVSLQQTSVQGQVQWEVFQQGGVMWAIKQTQQDTHRHPRTQHIWILIRLRTRDVHLVGIAWKSNLNYPACRSLINRRKNSSKSLTHTEGKRVFFWKPSTSSSVLLWLFQDYKGGEWKLQLLLWKQRVINTSVNNEYEMPIGANEQTWAAIGKIQARTNDSLEMEIEMGIIFF